MARFEKYGRRPPIPHEPDASLVTLLFSQVRDKETNGFVSQHIWLVEDENLKAVYPLNPGDQVEFEALVRRYRERDGAKSPISLAGPRTTLAWDPTDITVRR